MAEPARLIPQDYDSHTVVGAADEALARVEAATLAISSIEGRIRSNKVLQRALKAWKRGDTIKTAKYSLEATGIDDTNALAFHLLAIALDRMGHLHQALVTYERAFELDPNDTDLVLNLGLTAWNLELLDGAERMFRLFIEKRPEHPAGYNNLGSVQRDKRDLTGAIETLRYAIYRMPDQPMLWNSLATVLAEEGRAEESLIFYSEAQRLDPKFARVQHNLGYAYTHLGQLDKALDAYDAALKLAPNANERRESLHSRSICLIGMGRIEEGFREFEIRNDERFRAYVHHMIKAPLWNGEPLDGKRILIVAEQGLGDEFMFANILPDLQDAVGETGQLDIAVDDRLIAFVDALIAYETMQEFRGLAFAGYASLRFTGPSRALLGMQKHPVTCAVEVSCLRDVSGGQQVVDYAATLARNPNINGLLHWGQHNDYTMADVEPEVVDVTIDEVGSPNMTRIR